MPCSANPENFGEFVATDSILTVCQKPQGNHPLIHAERRILKDSSNLHRELLFAVVAEPDAARLDEGMLRSIAARACHSSARPTKLYRLFKSTVVIAKEVY